MNLHQDLNEYFHPKSSPVPSPPSPPCFFTHPHPHIIIHTLAAGTIHTTARDIHAADTTRGPQVCRNAHDHVGCNGYAVDTSSPSSRNTTAITQYVCSYLM